MVSFLSKAVSALSTVAKRPDFLKGKSGLFRSLKTECAVLKILRLIFVKLEIQSVFYLQILLTSARFNDILSTIKLVIITNTLGENYEKRRNS